ncbi:MAG: 16S rRNA (guanine(966)-N(2))-methyltransferase RsmD [Gaiellales bacterium]
MRIIAGTRKGARIQTPGGRHTRPTSDRVREAAFSLIGPLDGAEQVLDLFAGSGAMGLEALSRGVQSAVFVDDDRTACLLIERNALKLRFERVRVVRTDACEHAVSDARRGARYDLVLIDPPYAMLDSVLDKLSAVLPRIVAPAGLVLVESAAGQEPRVRMPCRVTRTYGDTRLSLYPHS